MERRNLLREEEEENNRVDFQETEIEDEMEKFDEEAASQAGRLRYIGTTIAYLLLVFGIAFFLVTYVGQRTMVSGDSMYDTLKDNDQLLVEKLSYRFGEPQRFDIVVFLEDPVEEKYFIKRVIGLPGETVQITDGVIYINGVELKEDYGYESIKRPGRAALPVTLGEDEYFVLGDNRNNSTDSRKESVGNIQKEQLLGKAFFRIWPLSAFGKIE